MEYTVLVTTVKEKDLSIRVTISADMKVSELYGIAASKGNQILRLIRRKITYKKISLHLKFSPNPSSGEHVCQAILPSAQASSLVLSNGSRVASVSDSGRQIITFEQSLKRPEHYRRLMCGTFAHIGIYFSCKSL